MDYNRNYSSRPQSARDMLLATSPAPDSPIMHRATISELPVAGLNTSINLNTPFGSMPKASPRRLSLLAVQNNNAMGNSPVNVGAHGRDASSPVDIHSQTTTSEYHASFQPLPLSSPAQGGMSLSAQHNTPNRKSAQYTLPEVRTTARHARESVGSFSGSCTNGSAWSSFDDSDASHCDDVVFASGLSLSSMHMRTTFPYHIAINSDGHVVQMGRKLSSVLVQRSVVKKLSYEHVDSLFRFVSTTGARWTIADLQQASSTIYQNNTAPTSNNSYSPSHASIPIEVEYVRELSNIPMLSISHSSSIPNINSQSGKTSSTYSHSLDNTSSSTLRLTGVAHAISLSPNSSSLQLLLILSPKISDAADMNMWNISSASHVDVHHEIPMTEFELLEENSRLKQQIRSFEESQKTERESMRRLIANVAHDLKTPLSSFSMGAEYVSKVTDSLNQALNVLRSSTSTISENNESVAFVNHRLTSSVVSTLTICQDKIEEILEVSKQMKDSNIFMTSAINRCIDCTKAEEGLKLVPQMESMDLQEAISLPLRCVQSLKTRHVITQMPLASSVCSHIISDKHWLQENLLCLLSNAIKYSHDGPITTRVFTISSQRLRQETQQLFDSVREGEMEIDTHFTNMSLAESSSDKVASKSINVTTVNASESVDEETPMLTGKQRMAVKKLLAKSRTSYRSSLRLSKSSTASVRDKLDQRLRTRSLSRDSESDMSGPSCASIPSSPVISNQPSLQYSPPQPERHLMSASAGPALASRSLPSSSMSTPMSNRLNLVVSVDSNSTRQQSYDGEECYSGKHSQGFNRSPLEHKKSHDSVENAMASNKESADAIAPSNVTAEKERDNLALLFVEVEDTGKGLSEEKIETLFSAFKQAQHLSGGTGLGLFSLAKRVDALGGIFGADKRRDGAKGSCFWFAIPYRPDTALAARVAKERVSNQEVDKKQKEKRKLATISLANLAALHTGFHHNGNGSNAFGRDSKDISPLQSERELPGGSTRKDSPDHGLNILLVEDSAAIAKLTSKFLQMDGHRVTLADNGQRAIDLAVEHIQEHKKTYDLVLMDLFMPVMDGFEAIQQMRDMERIQQQFLEHEFRKQMQLEPLDSQEHKLDLFDVEPLRATIVCCSALSDQETDTRAIAVGADGVLPKPFAKETFDELLKLLELM